MRSEPISSSGKSMCASITTLVRTSPSIIKFTEEEKFPDKEEFAAITALLLCALIRSATDSA